MDGYKHRSRKIGRKTFGQNSRASTPPAEVPIARMSRLAIEAFHKRQHCLDGRVPRRRIEVLVSTNSGNMPGTGHNGRKRGRTAKRGKQRQRTSQPTVVAMGASAGGVRALQTFFAAIPTDTGAAFVVVVHLDPDRRSELAGILATRTTMPVIQVQEREKLMPITFTSSRPDRRLEMVDHEIRAIPFEEPRGLRSPIDQFFRSVAERLGDGFAIILSGAGSDGSLGVRAVKESGGIILVQDPSEAEYSSMPRNAIATGIVDVVLPLRELAARLADLIRVKQGSPAPDLPPVDDEHVRRILAHLRMRTGHDFSDTSAPPCCAVSLGACR